VSHPHASKHAYTHYVFVFYRKRREETIGESDGENYCKSTKITTTTTTTTTIVTK
jgi:hypothetical protein